MFKGSENVNDMRYMHYCCVW